MAFRGSGGGGGGAVTFAPPAGQIDLGDANAEGGSSSAPRADHQHAFPAPTGPPGAVAVAGAAGGSARPARQDHTHAHTADHHRAGGHASLAGDFAALVHGHPPIEGADHGQLVGTGDDDHAQYHTDARGDARYPRLTVITAKGGLLAGTGAGAVGQLLPSGVDGRLVAEDAGSPTGLTFVDPPGGGVTDHGALTGLVDDDHPQYLFAELRIKTADESVVSSAAVQDDDHLTIPVAANTRYALTGLLWSRGSASGDLRLRLGVPAGATYRLSILHEDGTTAKPDDITEADPDLLCQLPTGFVAFTRIAASLAIGGTAGNVVVRWAQWTSNTTATEMLAGSWLEVGKV